MKRIIALAFAASCGVAQAQQQPTYFVSAEELAKTLNAGYATEEDRLTHGIAWGLIVGVHDTLVIGGKVCSPLKIDAGVAADVVRGYLARSRATGNAATAVAKALVETWPCVSSQRGSNGAPRYTYQ